ncbi:stress responsive alpha-beta barrel [Pochonia chlamydosporia 170]|uniref:Stress responsive alpha-beta barrel n=1 Tax=Pochonia chlamydosporia 170 TaxID=1380566 RepID=A0A179G2S1_METCM|nr:stress responsive alpha-beta barrel [Pochonia chlamydosporia 170]OAQ72047.1 stress responsive alpha-beta barrel [Pochonia chlamydosporia 170]
MAVDHVVIFQFKPEASAQAVKQCCDEMLGLKEQCLLASTGKPYIVRSKGGKDVSIEGLQNGFTHIFVVEFDSVADRDFYVKEDKAHHAFVGKWITSADSIVSKALVMDFAPGSFE